MKRRRVPIIAAIKKWFITEDGQSGRFDQYMVLLFTVSIFLPFIISTLVACGIAVVTMFHYGRRQRIFDEPYTRLLLGFLIVPFFVSAVYGNYKGMLLSLLVPAILVSGLYIKSIMNKQLFNRTMDLACVCSLFCFVVALGQKWFFYGENPSYRPESLCMNANYYGMLIEFVILIAVYRMVTNPKRTWAYLTIVGANLIGLYLCASLSALFATCCGLFVFLLLKKKYKLAAVFFVVTALFVGANFIYPLLIPRVESIDISFGQRFSIWETALKGIRQNPLLGQGPMAYSMICVPFGGYKTFHCHNLIFDVLLNYGVVGAGVFFFYGLQKLHLIVRRFKRGVSKNMNALVLALLTAVLAHGMTDVTIFWVQTAMLFFLIYSSVGTVSEEARQGQVSAIPLPDYALDLNAKTAYAMKNG